MNEQKGSRLVLNGMKTVRNIVVGTSIFLMLYALMPTINVSYDIMYLFFMIGNALVIYMVYAVLRYGVASKKKFNEGHWYDDVELLYLKDIKDERP